ncbi:expressed protein [Phakopsora pachyrhizi]|uniref:Expressed protein n=1 Tax=Phakopsora pachyrhizi TaxID=170000 RepID=A0AAV0AXG6_PHAPC|nr:expressed protein [Phakopsora pachyrhizi]
MFKEIGLFLAVYLFPLHSAFDPDYPLEPDWFNCSSSLVHSLNTTTWVCLGPRGYGQVGNIIKRFLKIRDGICVDANDESVHAVYESNVETLPFIYEDCENSFHNQTLTINKTATGYVVGNEYMIVSTTLNSEQQNSDCPKVSNYQKIMKCDLNKAMGVS